MENRKVLLVSIWVRERDDHSVISLVGSKG